MERQVPYVRESMWRGRTFTSLDQIRREAIRWCLEVAGQRVHGTTRRHPLDLFLEKERDTLRPLPERRWEPVAWTMAKVAPDSFCSVYGATYTVPWRYRGRDLSVRVGEKVVEFYLGEVLVKVQPRRHDRGRQIDPNDLPPDRIAFYQRTPQWCLRQAREAGPSVFEAVRQVLLVDTLTHLRQAQAILRQGGVYGPARLDAACRRALEFGDPSYRTIKRILKTGMDQVAADLPRGNHARSAKAYLRGKDTFALAGTRAGTGEE